MRKAFNIILYIFAAIGFILVIAYVAVELGLTKTAGIIDTQHDYFKDQLDRPAKAIQSSSTTPDLAWQNGEEWQVLKEAIANDQTSIKAAATKAGISPRLIVSILIVEQLRLFHSDREIFKTAFAPLKILGNQSQFSWGVMGIKQDTARRIEDNLHNAASPWYLGLEFSRILDYSATTTSLDSERFNRLTDENSRYYSYLYSALYVKEIETQWQKTGFPISNNVGVLATLFNIGFIHSHPNDRPQIGGAKIEIGDSKYSFGGLAQAFYYSDQLLDIFPR